MNKRTLAIASAAAVIAAAVGIVTLRQQAPKPAALAVAVPAPKMLDMQLDKALANQMQLLDKADKLSPDKRLPLPVAHSAGAHAVAAQDRVNTAIVAKVDEKASVALWFSGNEIAETDPCG
ncbi:MAG: hypothetical protein KC502_04435 [Myxococcales bacterium]|nr:hypothetical protein [Myxococcales bacterium]